MHGMDLAAVAAELYALPPGEFTAERNRQAKAAKANGDAFLAKQIASLPKPSASAGAINMLARRRPEETARVLDLGDTFRDAQQALDAGRMRSLGQQRSRTVGDAVRAGRDLAAGLGVRISDAAASEMEQTLRAAVADPQAAAAVRSGLLVRALLSNGLEPVDLTGAVAVPGVLPEQAPAGTSAEAPEPEDGSEPAAGRRDAVARRSAADTRERTDNARQRERARAQAELVEAQRRLEEAESELAGAERDAADAMARKDGVEEQLAELKDRIGGLEAELAQAEKTASLAERARRLASRLAEQERRAAARARDHLDSLS